jgi:tetratricopeptide (TPR) repeat protein
LTDRDEVLERAWSFGAEGAWDAAAELLRDHLEEFDEDPAVHCWLGVAERELGMEGVAYERFRRSLALGPEDPYVLATAGNGIAAFDDPDAEQALRTAALLAPGVAVTRLLYGAYLAREGMAADALVELRAARDIDPDDPQIAYELGIAHAFVLDWDGAVDALSDAVRLDPEEGWTRVVLGLVLLEGDRLEEATGELVSGARILENDVEAQLAASLAAAASGLDDTAWEMLERARLNALDADMVLVTAVEDRLDAGYEAAGEMLSDEVGPDLLRSRMSERP